MADLKRTRCGNFVPSEEKLLLDLVLKYKDVVECKKTDALTNKQKEDAWERLRAEFNAASALCPRTVVNLKSKLNNLKRITKKTLQAERCERRATGGGVPKLPSPAEEEKINVFRQIMGVGLDGLKNPYDSNGVRDLEGNQQEESIDLTLNVIKAKHLPCFAHTLALVPSRAIEQTPGLVALISKVKSIVTFFKHCINAADVLRKMQVKSGKTEGTILKLKQDVATRWNSTYYMLERFKQLRGTVNSILLKFPQAPPMVSAAELLVISDVIALLRPLEQVTVQMSGETYVTSSLVIPLVRIMKERLNKVDPETEIERTLQIMLLAGISKRFDSVEHVHILATASLLDPRFKKLHLESPLAVSQTIQRIVSKINEQKRTNGDGSGTATTVGDSSNISDDEDDLWSFHKKMVSKIAPSGDDPGRVPVEFRQYLNQSVIDIKDNPLQYWSTMKAVFPNVFAVAKQYLTIVGTSVPSERLFSKAGNIAVQSRNRLVPKRLSTLVFLNSLGAEEWEF